jgi:MFS family permease
VSGLGTRIRQATEPTRAIARNRDLRRLQLANIGSVLGSWAYLVALFVYAYDVGGAGAVALATVLRTIPAALTSPFTSVLGDRLGRRSVMVACDAVRAALMIGAGAVIAADGPAWVVFAVVTVSQIVTMAFQPAYQAILPGLSRTPEELAAANVASSLVLSVGAVIGPAIGAAILAVSTTPAVFGFNAASFVWSGLLVLGVREPARTGATRRARNPLGREVAAGVTTIAASRDLRFLTSLYIAQTLVAGAMNTWIVITALELTGAGNSAVGVFNGTKGIGGIVGGVLALALVSQGRLAGQFSVGLALYGGPLALIAGFPQLAVAAAAFALVGLGNTLVDVSATTLIQRAVPNDVLSRAFGALQSLLLASLGVGAVLAPLLIDTMGNRGAILVAGLVLPILAVLSWPRLRRVDFRAAAPPATELLRGVPMLGLLPEPTIERLGAESEQIRIPAGEVVFHEGDPGDQFYVVEEGEVEIAGKVFGPGEAFGEIALLRDVPRTATVTASSDVVLRAIKREDFVDAVMGQSDVVEAADALIESRLAPA